MIYDRQSDEVSRLKRQRKLKSDVFFSLPLEVVRGAYFHGGAVFFRMYLPLTIEVYKRLVFIG